jgi:receptor protein-tyrosine kinase
VFSLTQPKVYRAQTSIVVGQGGGIFQPQFGNVFQPFTQTMSSLLKSDVVANTVIRELGIEETPKSLLSHVHVSSTPSSAVIQVSFDSQDRADAVRTLGTMASAFTSLVEQKLGGPQGQGAGSASSAASDYGDRVRPGSRIQATPISPRPGRTMAFAGVIGLGLGILLALLRDALDDRIRGRDEMEELFAARSSPSFQACSDAALSGEQVRSCRRRSGLSIGSASANGQRHAWSPRRDHEQCVGEGRALSQRTSASRSRSLDRT